MPRRRTRAGPWNVLLSSSFDRYRDKVAIAVAMLMAIGLTVVSVVMIITAYYASKQTTGFYDPSLWAMVCINAFWASISFFLLATQSAYVGCFYVVFRAWPPEAGHEIRGIRLPPVVRYVGVWDVLRTMGVISCFTLLGMLFMCLMVIGFSVYWFLFGLYPRLEVLAGMVVTVEAMRLYTGWLIDLADLCIPQPPTIPPPDSPTVEPTPATPRPRPEPEPEEPPAADDGGGFRV